MRKKDVTKTGLAMAVPEEAVDGGRAYAGRFLAAVFLMMGLSGLFVPAFPSVSCGWVIPGICGTSICLGIQQRPAGSRTDPLSFICRDLLWTDSGWISDTV